MPAVLNLPPVDPDIVGFPLLSIGTLVRLHKSDWITIGLPRPSKLGQKPAPNSLCIFREVKTNEVQTLHYAHCAALWRINEFLILPDGAERLPECKERTARIPFDAYSDTQQAAMEQLEYYCKLFKQELVGGRLTIGAIKKIEVWLAGVPSPKGRETPLKRGALIRNYKAWVASGENICSLAHGNSFGTHESPLSDIQHIIFDAIENILLPYPDLELEDVRLIIDKDIKQRIAAGELGPRDDGSVPTAPCLSTLSNYRKRLNRYLAALIQDGPDKANREHQPRGKLILPWRPHLRWEVDHTLLPILIKIRVTNEAGDTVDVIVGQAWLTIVIDVTTRYLLALVVDIDPPSTVRVIAALRIALCPKAHLFSQIPDLRNRLDIAHIPESIGVDNGKDLPGNANDVKAILRDLNSEPELAGAYRGDHKPIVEGFNARIKHWFRKYPGAIPRKRTKFEPKDRRKSRVKPMFIEQARELAWLFAMNVYNIGKQGALNNASPQDLMLRGISRVETERSQGRPIRLRSILTKSPDEIERMFTIRVSLRVQNYGVQYKRLRWNSGRLANCLGRLVDVRINPDDVGNVWIHDGQEGWFVVRNIHPLYANGLSLYIHRQITRRLIDSWKRSGPSGSTHKAPFSLEDYLKNRLELLIKFFETAGVVNQLKLPREGRRSLRDSTRGLGRALDFALCERTMQAFDIRANRVPPGWGKVIELKKAEDGSHYAVPRELSAVNGRIQYPGFDDELDDDDEDMMTDPLRDSGGDSGEGNK